MFHVEKLLPFLIFGIIIAVKVIRGIAEFREGRPGTDDGEWADDDEGWTPTVPAPVQGSGREQPTRQPEAVSGPAGPSPVRRPGNRIEMVLEEFKRQLESDVPHVPEPALATPTPPAPASPHRKKQRNYLPAESVEAAAAPPAPPQSQKELVDQTMAKAFPRAIKMVRETRRSVRSPIHLSARGKKNLRHGILMAEVLGPPRAYDI